MSAKRMRVRFAWPVACAVLTLAVPSPARAQKVTIVPDLTPRQVLGTMVDPLGSTPAGEAIALATAIEISTQPLGTASGGFVFKLDPSTGQLSRTTTTFGPSFAERALTLGEGKISMGATFSASTYDKLSDFSLANLPIGTVSGSASAARTGTADLHLTSRTLALSGFVGVTDQLDVGAIVPLVGVKLDGTSSLVKLGRCEPAGRDGGRLFRGRRRPGDGQIPLAEICRSRSSGSWRRGAARQHEAADRRP